jgi:signal peptidase I
VASGRDLASFGNTEVRQRSRFGSTARELLETVLLTIIVFLLIRSVVQNYIVDGFSMQPTLQNGQYLFVNKAVYWFAQPKEGDIIIMRYPPDPKTYFVKRIIAVPGDTVEIAQGKVVVNGQVLIEPYIAAPPAYEMPKRTIPAHQYFVLGDNRNNSNDSHQWGTLPASDLVGKAFISYWPPSHWGLLQQATYAHTPAPTASPK